MEKIGISHIFSLAKQVVEDKLREGMTIEKSFAESFLRGMEIVSLKLEKLIEGKNNKFSKEEFNEAIDDVIISCGVLFILGVEKDKLKEEIYKKYN